MALTSRVIVGKLELLEDGRIQMREDTIIEQDGVEVIRTYHRRVLEPGDDVSAHEKRTQDVCAAVWTAKVVADFDTVKQLRNRPIPGPVDAIAETV